MLKKLQIKSWLLMLCMLLGVGNAWAEEVSVTSFEAISGDLNDYISYVAAKGSASTTPGVYSGVIRVYQNGGTFTVTAKDGAKINSVTLGSSMTTKVTYSIDSGTASSEKSISANATLTVDDLDCSSILFTCKGTDKNSRLYVNSLSVSYTLPSASQSTMPTISGTSPFLNSTDVTITAVDGATIFYTLDGSEPTTGSTLYNGVITLNETTTVKAIAVENGKDPSSVASKTFTKATVMTVAEARAAIDAATGLTGVYVTGTVSEIVTAYNSQYGNITYNISADGSTTSDQLQAYRGKSYNGDNFASADDIQVGDVVVIFGNLKKYNDTYELDADNQLVSLTRPAAAVEKPAFSPAGGNFEEAQSVTITCTTEGATIYYTIDGSDPTSSSTMYSAPIPVSQTTTIKAIAVKGDASSAVAEATYTILVLKTIAEARAQETGIVETKGVVTSVSGKNAYIQDATAAILVYGNSNITDLSVGDEIKVSGELTTYNGLLEIKNPTYTILSHNNTVNPTVMTIAEINASDAPQSWLVRIEEASATAIEGQNVTLAQGESTVVVRFNATSDITFSVNDVVSVTGNIGCFNSVQIANPQNVVVQENTDPVITASNVTIDYNATSGSIAYTIENAVTGAALEATTTADWISDIVVDAAAITFTTTANEGTEDRTATFTLTYGEVTKDVTVTQGHLEVDYATLPFEWEGGVKDDLLALDGVSANDLGSDYAESNAPYRVKFDTTGDYILVKTDSRPGVVTIGVKMLGGANTSTITVQGSSDGETFTDVETLTISGSTNDVLTLVTTNDFAENTRYVKLLFTKGSNVGVGPITIEKYTIKQDATVSFKKDGEAITTLEANLNDEIEVAVECSVEGAELSITSSNSRVAKYEDGVVKALSEGEATITATFAGNDEYKSATATLAVTVVDNRQDVTLAFNDIPAEININETATYAVTATPTVEGVTYSSSNTGVVIVDEATGAITAVAVGTATITATFAGDANYKATTATYTIKVVNPNFVASKYELVTDASTLVAGDEIVFGYIGTYKVSGTEYETAQVMSTEYNSTNNIFGAIDMASHNDNIIEIQDGTAIITLTGSAEAWTFQMPDGTYLVSNGRAKDEGGSGIPTKNENIIETTEDNTDTHAQATIAIDGEGNATVLFQGGNGANNLCYNVNSGKNQRFSCYVNKMTGLQIYRKVASSETLKGDVNKDGSRTIADVTALVNIILGKATPDTNPDYDFDAADVNGDGGVPTIADVTALVNIILGKDQ